MASENVNFTKMVEAFRWKGNSSGTKGHASLGSSSAAGKGFSEHSPKRSPQGGNAGKNPSEQYPSMHSSPEEPSSPKAKRRLMLAFKSEADSRKECQANNLAGKLYDEVAGSLHKSKTYCVKGRQQAGGMLERAQARLDAAVASDWYKPTRNSHGKKKKPRITLGSRNKRKKNKSPMASEGIYEDVDLKVADSHSPEGCKAITANQMKLPCFDKLEQSTTGNGEFHRKDSSKKKTIVPVASISGSTRRKCTRKKMKSARLNGSGCMGSHDKSNMAKKSNHLGPQTECLGPSLVHISSTERARATGTDAQVDEETEKVSWALDASPVSIEQHKKKKEAGKYLFNEGSSHCHMTNASWSSDISPPWICYERKRKKHTTKVRKAYVHQEVLNRSWSSDESPSVVSLASSKTRRMDDTKSHYFLSAVDDLPSEQSKQRGFDNTADNAGPSPCTESLNLDMSLDTIFPAADLGKAKRYRRRKGKNAITDKIKSDECSVVPKQSFKKKKGGRLDRQSCVDNVLNHEATSNVSPLHDVLQKKKRHRVNNCASLALSLRGRELHEPTSRSIGGYTSKNVLNVGCSSAGSPSIAIANLKKGKKRRRRIDITKADRFDHRAGAGISSISDSSPERTLGKKRWGDCKPNGDAIGQRTIINKGWVPPVSVFGLIQEEIYKDPWKVLVACMLLNKTSGAQMRQVIWDLFNLCPNPEAAVATETQKIEEVIRSLGLQRKRARMIQRFSSEYLDKLWTNVTDLHGIGKYATDAYAIFCEGRWQEVEPNDHKLNDYWQYLCATDGLGYAFKDDRKKDG